MPALQVRDFPEGLYERLRYCAEANHRSIAQQTVVAVEQMLEGAPAAGRPVPSGVGRPSHERMQRKRELFARAQQRQQRAEGRMPDFAAIMQGAKQERDGRFDGLIADATEGTL